MRSTRTLFKTAAAVSAFALGMGAAQAGGLLGENYVSGTIGTTFYDKDVVFDSRENSLNLGVGGNWNIRPNVDLSAGYGYSRVTGRDFGDAIRLTGHDLIVGATLFGEAAPGVRPYVGAGAGWVRARLGRDFSGSDDTHLFSVGSGVEFDLLPSTALNLGAAWVHVGSLSDLGVSKQQQIVWNARLSQRLTEQFSGVVDMSHGNDTNDTTFNFSLLLHF